MDSNLEHQDNELHYDGENAPLLSSGDSAAPRSNQKLSVATILALTCINGGLQVFFSTVMANLSPYLQKLGLSKSAAAAITIVLPLSGAFVGPTAGALSDRLRTRFGRRRPIVLSGTLLTIACLLLLAWTEQIVQLLAGCSGDDQSCDEASSSISQATIALAVIFTALLSISVQPVQAGVRALMVDVAPPEEQSRASAYASRIQGAMAIFSFFASSLNLTSLPGLGKLTQFQALACLNLITLGGTVSITCVCIREKDSRRVTLDDEANRSVWEVFRHIWKTVFELPGRVAQVCKAQFSSWFAWFPLLYYTTTFIGELDTSAAVTLDNNPGNQLAQAGSLGSLSFAILGFIFTLTLPVAMPYLSRRLVRSHSDHDDLEDDDSVHDSRLRGLTWLWVATQPILGVLLVLTLAAAYQWQGILLIAVAGLPWAVTQWVPWAIIGHETARLGLTDRAGGEHDSQAGAILGVHNMAISIPQVLSGGVCSLTYKVAEAAGSKVPTAWVLAISGLAAFVAAYLAKRVL